MLLNQILIQPLTLPHSVRLAWQGKDARRSGHGASEKKRLLLPQAAAGDQGYIQALSDPVP